ncbi:MAG: hypothetical protein KJ799_06980, partial [Bacteroidetes bacterium]|nr:hypothetical protein [Bacteroidota bacterium]
MRKNYLSYLAFILLFAVFISCSKDTSKQNRVVIGISADLETINPLYAFTFDEGNIVELLFQRLVRHDWNKDINEMTAVNMLAEKIVWSGDKLSVKINIKENVMWSDGEHTTVDDIIFSFVQHSNHEVKGRMLGYFENYFLDKN